MHINMLSFHFSFCQAGSVTEYLIQATGEFVLGISSLEDEIKLSFISSCYKTTWAVFLALFVESILRKREEK